MKFNKLFIKVYDLEKSLDFWVRVLNFKESSRQDMDEYRKSYLSLVAPDESFCLDMCYYWDENQPYTKHTGFGHLSFEVKDLYKLCEEVVKSGYELTLPPKDGRLAYIMSPENIELEIFQRGEANTPCEPWLSMKETKQW